MPEQLLLFYFYLKVEGRRALGRLLAPIRNDTNLCIYGIIPVRRSESLQTAPMQLSRLRQFHCKGDASMLVLSRKQNEKIVLPGLGITIEVLKVSGNNVKIGIAAPRNINVVRGEITASSNLFSSNLFSSNLAADELAEELTATDAAARAVKYDAPKLSSTVPSKVPLKAQSRSETRPQAPMTSPIRNSAPRPANFPDARSKPRPSSSSPSSSSVPSAAPLASKIAMR